MSTPYAHASFLIITSEGAKFKLLNRNHTNELNADHTRHECEHTLDLGVTVDEAVSFIVKALEDPLT